MPAKKKPIYDLNDEGFRAYLAPLLSNFLVNTWAFYLTRKRVEVERCAALPDATPADHEALRIANVAEEQAWRALNRVA